MILLQFAFWFVLFSVLAVVFFVAYAIADLFGVFAALFLFAWLIDRLIGDD